MSRRTTCAGLPQLLAAALLVAGCADSVSPERRDPGAPVFSHTGPGVALDQVNGSLGARGTAILKGFNPTNPHLGSAIVATFFWLGSSNIITSVGDHLTDGTPVGNTYTFVEYATIDGISMATYVATNVQNFPDPNPNQDRVLVVQANLSSSITDGGVMISAYTGVNAVTAQALGPHRSASGSGSSPTTAAPGPIAVGAGALAYAVTMSNAVVGTDPPAGFASVTNLSDASMKADGQYAVPATAGTVDPQWTWYFSSPSQWLATVLTLNPAPSQANQPPTAAFTPSCSGLTCSFTSTSSDPDGSIAAYSWAFGDPAGTTSTMQNPSHTYPSAGTYTVTLTVTDNQGASASTSQSVTVNPSNQPPVADFTFGCSGLTCSFMSTSSDPDGSIAAYSWSFGDNGTSADQNPTHSYPRTGSYSVTLTVTDNQNATSAPVTKTVAVTAPNQPPVADFTFSCSGLTCSFRSTSSDPDGSIAAYSWSFGDNGTSTAPDPSHTYPGTGSYSVTLTVTDNQNATSAPVTKTVAVTAPNQPPIAGFNPSCSGLACSFTSTSSDPDGSISAYSWNFGDGGTSPAQNPSHTYASGGTYTVRLTVTDNRGATNSTSRNVSVTAPNRPPTVNAGPDETALTGLLYSLRATFSDPDNGPWSYTINWGDGGTTTGGVSSQGTITAGHTYFIGILPRSYTITVTVVDSRGARGSDTKVVTVIL
jgi:PKD repeat protein